MGDDYIDTDTDERGTPMRELSVEKLVDNIKDLKTEKTSGISKSDEETLLITTSELKYLVSESRGIRRLM